MKSSWLEQFLEKSIQLLNRDDNRKRLQLYLIDPLLNHVMERVFPYILLSCVLFTLLLIIAMLTFGMLIVQLRTLTSSSSGASLIHPISNIT